MNRSRWLVLAGVIALTPLVSCIEDNAEPEGLRRTTENFGPKIVFDLDARPFPDVPFPNDLATRVDPDSPTNRRINVSLRGGSDQEEKVREFVNRMTGFGVFSPITVQFDGLLDLADIAARHQEKVPDFTNDAVYLVKIDPKSKEFGQLELIDLGLGNFPILHAEPDRYYDNDPRQMGTNLLFESHLEEDVNGNGLLDPMEDTDDDHVWDKPNLLDQDGDPVDSGNVLSWYERETNTLIMRPVHVLEPKTKYAVVLTRALKGDNGAMIDSPFEWINHTRQTEDLAPLRTILPQVLPTRFDSSLESVRFAWSFTTQDPADDLKAIRAGLYGHGTLKRLSNEYPAQLALVHNGVGPDAEKPRVFNIEPLLDFLLPVLPEFFGVAATSVDVLEKNLRNIDYIVSGSFESPYFLADKDGLAETDNFGPDRIQADDNEVFDLDPYTGEAYYKPNEVTFMCTVPKEAENRKPPFPTVMYSHAINSTRLEILLFGGAFAKFGFAVCAIDAVGHGVVIPAEYDDLITTATDALGVPYFPQVIGHHRARDLNNDGLAESGGMFFTADILHTRDNFRQTAVDQFQFIRIMRSWDGERVWPTSIDEDNNWVKAHREIVAPWDQDGDGEPDLAGDFNGDGIIDFGGNQAFVGMGTSLGGIQTGLISGIEPTIKAAVSNAGGGGMTDISSRTTIRNARDGVTLRMIGPLVHGTRFEDAEGNQKMRLYFTIPTADRSTDVEIAVLDGIEDGDRFELINPNRDVRSAVPEDEKRSNSYVRDGRVRVAIAADADFATARLAKLGFDAKVSLTDDIMPCKERSRCDEACPGGSWTCDADNLCIPRDECIQSFDPDTYDGELADELNKRVVTDPREFGDPLILNIYGADGELKQTVDSFQVHGIYENVLYPAGAPLAALAQGLGLKRQTPDFRRFIGIAQTLIEGADPSVYAARYFNDPIEYPYEEEPFNINGTNFFMAGTVGDQTVPISGGIANARTAGIVDTFNIDPRYDKTENQYLIDTYVYEGIHWLDRFPDQPGTLFDADDLDNGLFRLGNDPDNPDPNPDAVRPVRASIETEYGVSVLRLPYLKTSGEHTFNAPLEDIGFDTVTFMTNQTGWWLISRGFEISDDPCFEDPLLESCDFYDFDTFTWPDRFSCETGGCRQTYR